MSSGVLVEVSIGERLECPRSSGPPLATAQLDRIFTLVTWARIVSARWRATLSETVG